MLIPIQYHKRKYPSHIHPEIDEIAGNFDTEKINSKRKFSLHTEYAYGKRNFSSKAISRFNELQISHKKGIPQLWKSEAWALEFADFIYELCDGRTPTIIEIHPPFSDYTKSLHSFVMIYRVFENAISQYFPNIQIYIENRTGSIYNGGKFVISTGSQLWELCEQIENQNLNLRIAFDIPQLLSAYGGVHKIQTNTMLDILNQQNAIKPFVNSIHLWGKKLSKSGRISSHVGDLNTYFIAEEKKESFLNWFLSFVNDEHKRYFVPEVNSSDEDLYSIVSDLEKHGVSFL